MNSFGRSSCGRDNGALRGCGAVSFLGLPLPFARFPVRCAVPFRIRVTRVDPRGCGDLRDYKAFGCAGEHAGSPHSARLRSRLRHVSVRLPNLFRKPFTAFSTSVAMLPSKLLRKKAVRSALRQALTQSTAAAGTTAAGGGLHSLLTALATGVAGTAGIAGVASFTGLHMADVRAMFDTVLAHAGQIDFAALSAHVTDGARTIAHMFSDLGAMRSSS